ncbi:MAG TPA: flavodoxin-dependent (E)-4-hydroxy-3-methylbut-2-enyl-diphosphate synthase [Candidatus Omnitrophota bacterium]|nr:flavodoxin-dependent (E)-4-hydroxy-3-methylbut-2-enyl-diphosphate synthase [Candidatus Omnitrophota bacterium]MDD4940855.1 flavodoxin-dependent (E)-4-hydroxy-3-methylbut-2-enyl-diphosphate synthase [Candidatus Omnitrophota bacterium]HNQ50481.1 flavodoxin-dependent (E)-4-hydroxy-3-methylbut-2-enyl-diphosphate synthase [Candidatus Omnitrophota bacterium]HQO38007.1 flavodoxin-dependent (E)-4-hydroxy-3-methylbut-2-enyl-diphosphate synthase [Candidatus Omnitrophota bacterium]HQQ05576.1 flavodoxin
MKRRISRVIRIGPVKIGGNNPVAVQSMAKAKTSDVRRVITQIAALQKAGCEIIRVAVKDLDDARAIRLIRKEISIPLVADIHFDHRLALAAVASGADKIRLNPGNIFRPDQVKQVARAALDAGIPIRVGLNSGSVRGSGDPVRLMVAAALAYTRQLERYKFRDIVLSVKANDAGGTIAAYRAIAPRCDYPLHLGVTATGLPFEGMIKSCVALGSLLIDGIGDTIRISLTDTPQEEVKTARALLASLGLRNYGPSIISCPTCGRCEVDLVGIVRDLERQMARTAEGVCRRAKPLTVAVMGCVVNGPGEARHADIGIAFGKGTGLLFKKGRPVRKIAADKSVRTLLREISILERS